MSKTTETVALTGKAGDIEAFRVFIEAVKKVNLASPGGSYFEDLLDTNAESVVTANIRSDFPPFMGLLVPEAVFDQLQVEATERLEVLKAQVAELEGWDVRKLKARELSINSELDSIKLSAGALREELAGVQARLNPTGR